MEVVYRLDVEAFGCAHVFEDLPVSAYWPVALLSAMYRDGVSPCLRALEQRHEETGKVQPYSVANHQITEPPVELGRKYAFASCQRAWLVRGSITYVYM